MTGAQIVGIAERQRGKIPLVDLDYGDVRFEIDADNRRVYGAASRCEKRVAGDGQRDVDAQPLRTGHHVGVRDDVALRIDDHTRAGRALGGDEVCFASNDAFSGHEDVAKIWTTAGETKRASASVERLNSSAAVATDGFVCACAAPPLTTRIASATGHDRRRTRLRTSLDLPFLEAAVRRFTNDDRPEPQSGRR